MSLERNNFVIAGLGSSGTKFLAQLMNRSARWHVVHMGICQSFDMDGTTPVMAQPLLDARPRFFGDVNGLLLFHLLELRVGKKAVIIRDPRDTLLSWYCVARGDLKPSFFSLYAGGYFALDECIEHGIRCIRFERMITDVGYLGRVIRYFGIRDVLPTAELLATRINAKRDAFCETYAAIDAPTRALFERAVGGFAQKYYGEQPRPHADDFADVEASATGEPDGDVEPDEPVDPPKPAPTRSTTLGFAGHELPSQLLRRPSLDALAARLGLGTPDHQGSPRRLEEARVFHRNLTLLVVGPGGSPQRVLVETRREGAPYFLRTAHLHLSHLERTVDASLRETLALLAARLGEASLDDLWPAHE